MNKGEPMLRCSACGRQRPARLVTPRVVDKGSKVSGIGSGVWFETYVHCVDNDPCVAKAVRFASACG